jgi:hypothetical protein
LEETENPRVDSSILSLDTAKNSWISCSLNKPWESSWETFSRAERSVVAPRLRMVEAAPRVVGWQDGLQRILPHARGFGR